MLLLSYLSYACFITQIPHYLFFSIAYLINLYSVSGSNAACLPTLNNQYTSSRNILPNLALFLSPRRSSISLQVVVECLQHAASPRDGFHCSDGVRIDAPCCRILGIIWIVSCKRRPVVDELSFPCLALNWWNMLLDVNKRSSCPDRAQQTIVRFLPLRDEVRSPSP